jgi:hypothetical protein
VLGVGRRFDHRAHEHHISPALIVAVTALVTIVVFHGWREQLRNEGIRLLYGPEVLELHEPGAGSQRVALYPWRMILDALEPQDDS